jgi:uncharacterized iron-regulated membrane protein
MVGYEGGEMYTAVVLDAHMQLCIDMVRCYIYGLLAVYGHVLVLGGVVGCARRDAQHVLLVVRHAGSNALWIVYSNTRQ